MNEALRLVRQEPPYCDWCGTALFQYGEFWKDLREQVTCAENDEDGMHEPAQRACGCSSDIPNHYAPDCSGASPVYASLPVGTPADGTT